jgi:hypothetical protein
LAPLLPAACRELSEGRARVDRDWLRRETALALLAEARRDAARDRESACVTTLDHARLRMLNPGN